MSLLSDITWKTKYTPEDGNLLKKFYIPALECAIRYDRSTGYFTAEALAAASRGVEGLIRNNGRMRLIVGCTLGKEEVDAISKGEAIRDAVEASLLGIPLSASNPDLVDALELLAWMVAKGILEVKVAIPCNSLKKPIQSTAIFHEKAGIIEDKTGDRLAFNGSINETSQGWKRNWDSFHVFTSWGGSVAHVDAEEISFKTLWGNNAKAALVIEVPLAIKEELLKFLPKDEKIQARLNPASPENQDKIVEKEPAPPEVGRDLRDVVWSFLRQAPSMANGGESVGEATSAVTPWPHQIHAFNRMYRDWPPKLLIADEVGLGKTIQAGMILRQAWLAGRIRRALILAPAALLKQWQIELREKFNLNWPIYDGQKLSWYPSPGLRGNTAKAVSRDEWHCEPFIIASSHLMRRRDRVKELLEDAEPWDLIVLDEAHHARRRGGGIGAYDDRPNQLLRLMTDLKEKSQGLIFLTATPMQVSAIEVWDLLNLLGLPLGWTAHAFLRFFENAAQPLPGNPEMVQMASLFRTIEESFGSIPIEEAQRFAPKNSRIKAKRILKALREQSTIPIKQLEAPERRAAVNLMKTHSPIRYLISRHTRELLRKYHKDGKLKTRIADRHVEDRFVEMSDNERIAYLAVEDYISSTYNNASPDKQTAIGFVMTVYRRRLASSFAALLHTLSNRKNSLDKPAALTWDSQKPVDEDISDDEISGEVMDIEEAAELERQALSLEEQSAIEILIGQVRKLPTDTKAIVLIDAIEGLRAANYKQVMVFTQYTDTLDFLRKLVVDRFGQNAVICFSGRGGEKLDSTGRWQTISREETKKIFREQQAQIMLCTDAAAEGLNFQFCGALINYDMPWNPMKVEQRIGRIDRLGQEHALIRIINLHYQDTVETDVYLVLRERIKLFQSFVGKLQPILARVPSIISAMTLASGQEIESVRTRMVSELETKIGEVETTGFDLVNAAEGEFDDHDRPEPLYGLNELKCILQKKSLQPVGVEVTQISSKDFSYLIPGSTGPVRVTVDREFFENHPDSTELWSPGAPVFPKFDDVINNMQDNQDIDEIKSIFVSNE